MKTVKTPKGTELPLINLKGRDYLQVAHRIQWFNEENPNFRIVTELLSVTDEQTIARTQVIICDNDGKLIKSATATKRETKKDFPDHTEKAETGSVGRALLMLGYGTAFALSDLDEGDRIVDSPMPSAKSAPATLSVVTADNSSPVSTSSTTSTSTVAPATPVRKQSFRKANSVAAATSTSSDDLEL